ncbi:MAG: hypothetical protein ACR2F2_07875 [Pyrinomonadaceae bacterium]
MFCHIFAQLGIRISARLLKTNDQTVIWTGQFEKAATDEFRLHNEIAL